MAIRAKQIGWSQESNLLWQISYQLDRLIQVAGGPYTTTTTTTATPTTTTTTTTVSSFSVRYYMGSYNATTPCAGPPVSGNPNYSSTSNPLLLSQLFSDAALTTATIMSNGGGFYSFSYDSGATVYSAEFTAFGTVISAVIPC
jgi:hypothetical protein